MLFAQRYQIEEEIGAGAAARVVRARDMQLERQVALKLLEAQGELSEEARFLDEARALAGFRHPNVIELLDFGVFQGQHFLVLEFLPRGSLHPWAGRLPVEEAVQYGSQVLVALEAGHRQGIIHRDVKPGNVLLADSGQVKLSDFGLAKFRGREGKTATGVVLGTPEYMAPELFRGKPASSASDVYAWGSLFYELLTGEYLYSGEVSEIARIAVQGKWKNSRVQGGPGRAIERAMALRPEDRPSAGELARFLVSGDLREGSSGGTGKLRSAATLVVPRSSARDPGRPRGTGAEARPGSVPRAAWASALGVLLLVTSMWLWQSFRAPRERAPSNQPSKTALRPQGLLETWRERVRELDVAARLRRLHAALEAVEPLLARDNYGEAMWDQQHMVPNQDVAQELRSFREHLPYRREMEEDSQELGAVLGDEEVDFATRWSLYQVLQTLDHVDAYLMAWGEKPAYEVARGMRHLVAVDSLDLEAQPVMLRAPDPPEAGPPPGSYRIHRWPTDWDLSKCVLVPDPDDPLYSESAAWMLARMNPEEHAFAFGEIDLGPDPDARYGQVELEMTLANLTPPSLLAIRWNQFEIHYRTPGRWVKSGHWMIGAFPDHRVRVRLPKGFLRKGRNTLRLSTGPTAGLRHALGLDLNYVGVILSAP